jgi:hypothetical protein
MEPPETVVGIIENDLANCCQNGWDLVDYRNWGKGIEAVAAKTGLTFNKGVLENFTKHAFAGGRHADTGII